MSAVASATAVITLLSPSGRSEISSASVAAMAADQASSLLRVSDRNASLVNGECVIGWSAPPWAQCLDGLLCCWCLAAA